MTDRSGLYKGRHYTTYVEEVKALKRAGDYADAERLLLALVGAAENEARANRWPVAPWYYSQLAIVYRKTKQPDKELQILERYAGCWRLEDGPLPTDTVSAIGRWQETSLICGMVSSLEAWPMWLLRSYPVSAVERRRPH